MSKPKPRKGPSLIRVPKCPNCGNVYDPRIMHEERKGERIEEGKPPEVVEQWKCPNCNAWVDLDKCEWVRIPLDAGSAIYGEKKVDSMDPGVEKK